MGAANGRACFSGSSDRVTASTSAEEPRLDRLGAAVGGAQDCGTFVGRTALMVASMQFTGHLV